MGREISTVIEEFNEFCKGNHPCFNGELGTHKVLFNETKAPDLRIKNSGMFYRFGTGDDSLFFVAGSLDRT